MIRQRRNMHGERGQMLVLSAVVMTSLLMVTGLVLDGGNALVQRRASQNASDFAALAGARVIAHRMDGDLITGTDANVRAAILNTVNANDGIVTFGSGDAPRYVNAAGALLGYVGSGITAEAVGVSVSSSRSWRPFLMGIFQMAGGGGSDWVASAPAVAKGGWSMGGPPPGGVFPAGIASSFFSEYDFCTGPISNSPSDPCYPKNLTPGNLNVPGGFGWLKFGCDGYGLGQVPPANSGGCRNDTPFLNEQIGPPGKSYGCCTEVGLAGSPDWIGSLEGNKASADCSYYVDNEVTVVVPVWDTAHGNGDNAYYHIVGFAGFQITGCPGAKNLEGVWRKAIFSGPVSSTPPACAGAADPATACPWQALGTQLVR